MAKISHINCPSTTTVHISTKKGFCELGIAGLHLSSNLWVKKGC